MNSSDPDAGLVNASPRKPGSVLLIAITLAVLLGLYVGGYYATVEPEFLFVDRGAGPVPVTRTPVYRVGRLGFLAVPIFAPVHGCDRRLRQEVWEIGPRYRKL